MSIIWEQRDRGDIDTELSEEESLELTWDFSGAQLFMEEVKIPPGATIYIPTETLVRDSSTQFGPSTVSTTSYSYENIIMDYTPVIKEFTDKGSQTSTGLQTLRPPGMSQT